MTSFYIRLIDIMKTKVTKFLKVFLISLMLRWFLYFAISLNNTSLMSLDQLLDVCPSYCGITNYFTTSEKKVFKISEIFWVLERVSQFATRLMLSFLILLWSKLWRLILVLVFSLGFLIISSFICFRSIVQKVIPYS